MQKTFPLHYTLDDKTEVTVNKTGNHLYDFSLKPNDAAASHFIYNDEEEFTDAKEAALSFDQLNALRRFWLLTGGRGIAKILQVFHPCGLRNVARKRRRKPL